MSLALINETLDGLLYAHEREEEKPLRHKFGYWHMVETRMVRAQLIAEGLSPEDVAFQHRLSDRIVHNHRHDLSLSQMQTVKAIAWCAAIDTLGWWPVPKATTFTREELNLLIEHFEGANDPVARSILEKARNATNG